MKASVGDDWSDRCPYRRRETARFRLSIYRGEVVLVLCLVLISLGGLWSVAVMVSHGQWLSAVGVLSTPVALLVVVVLTIVASTTAWRVGVAALPFGFGLAAAALPNEVGDPLLAVYGPRSRRRRAARRKARSEARR